MFGFRFLKLFFITVFENIKKTIFVFFKNCSYSSNLVFFVFLKKKTINKFALRDIFIMYGIYLYIFYVFLFEMVTFLRFLLQEVILVNTFRIYLF